MVAEPDPGLIDLPDEDKRALMTELGDEVAGHSVANNPALAAFVEARWQDYQQHPEQVSPWREVKARILGPRGTSSH